MRNPIRGATIAGHVRSLLDDGAAGALADGELLERFATRSGDPAEAAFAALVERHGPMVLRACRSILRDPHRAEDAFQSTFLLLARRAGSLWVRDSIAPWLHSVACRVASGARAADGRRVALERRAALASRSADEPGRDDLGPALHQEIERLPDRLKAPVVLCYLEGLTHDQAAEHLACPVGTVRSRLARGRERLRRGLIRQGFAPPRADPTPPAPVSASLAALAIRAAGLASGRSTIGLFARCSVLLSEGVLKPMMIHPLKAAAVLLLATGAIAAGLGATSGQEDKPPEKAATPAEARDRSAVEKRFEAIEQRLRDLELKLEEVAGDRSHPSRKVPVDRDASVKIRPRFDDALVEKVFATLGQVVKKGEPLVALKCIELARAKTDLRLAYVQWDHDRKFLKAREPLHKDGRITELVWTDTVNDEKKSRLNYLVAREKLATFGMTNEQVDQLLVWLSDAKDPKAVEDDDQIRRLSTLTIVSPFDGMVIERNVIEGNFYGQTEVLFVIAPRKP